MIKAHLACGTVYLKDYINVDVAPHFIIPDVPREVLEINITTKENYYKHNFCKGSGFCVADVKASLDKMPFVDDSVGEVILYQALEHIPNYKIDIVLKEIGRIIKKNGIFLVSVPDVKETAKMLARAETEEEEDWGIRLIHGTQRNEWSHHFNGFIPRTLKNLLSNYGFGNFENIESINFYPVIHLKAHKL